MVAVKPKDSKMISDSCSLSYPGSFSLTHALQLSVSDCMINIEAHSLFILVFNLKITLVPHNYKEFNPLSTRRVNLYDFTWFFYIIDSPNRNIEE